MQNWISSCEKYNNDERLNIAKQQMMQLVGDISVLTEIAAQCYNYHLYEFVCLPKPDLLNWVIYLYNFSKSIEATFQ